MWNHRKKFRQINNHVVVEEILRTEDKTDAGIIIPQTVKNGTAEVWKSFKCW
jgi:hypothetical protein